jgi:hypothetical protein
MKKITGIVDAPLQKSEDDKLQTAAYELALINFLKNTQTPVSVALQGEWGSGKTSFMNRLQNKLCRSEGAEFYGVWLNTWHYALMQTGEDILVSVIQALTEEVLKISKKEHPEKLKRLISNVYNVGKTVFKGISKVAVKTAVSQISSDAADAVDDIAFSSGQTDTHSLSDLRNNLENLIAELMNKNAESKRAQKAFIFFIDDLDRIEPAVAVNILELLKNIFEINHCIFVLAIDYDVVVKGLKSKFGELNDQNEREFRSFFDKIIQLPFQMPVSSYVADDYVKEMLLSLNLVTPEEAKNTDFIRSMVRFTVLSLGSNPRSVKRLMNTLSFINLLLDSKNEIHKEKHHPASHEKQILYALMAIQTAFPSVFNLLADNPHPENWNRDFALKHDIIIDKSAEKNQNTPAFTHQWKEILYRFCAKHPYLKKHYYNITDMIMQMAQIAENAGHDLAQILPDMVSLLAVTNIKAEPEAQIEINNIRVLYALNKKLLPTLREKLQPEFPQLERKGRMIARITYRIGNENRDYRLKIDLSVRHNRIYLGVGTEAELIPLQADETDAWKALQVRGKTEVFNQKAAQIFGLNSKSDQLAMAHKPLNGLFVKSKKLIFGQRFHTVSSNTEIFYTDSFIAELSDFIRDFLLLMRDFQNENWESI